MVDPQWTVVEYLLITPVPLCHVGMGHFMEMPPPPAPFVTLRSFQTRSVGVRLSRVSLDETLAGVFRSPDGGPTKRSR